MTHDASASAPEAEKGPVPAPASAHVPAPDAAVPNPRRTADAPDGTAPETAASDHTTADDTTPDDQELTFVDPSSETDALVHSVTTRAMAARLPRLIGTALRLAWDVDRRALVALLACQAAAGALEAAGLLATTATITAVISSGDIVARLRDAAPSLTLLAVAVGARAGLGIAVVYLSQRLSPLLNRKAEWLLLEAVSGAELEAYDHPGFTQQFDQAAQGAQQMRTLLSHSQDVIAAAASFAAAASVITYLHPILLPLLLLGAIPRGVAAVRAAQVEYQSNIETRNERIMLSHLRWRIADDWSANQMRAFTLAPHLLRIYQRHADKVQHVTQRGAARAAKMSIVGALLGGVAAGLVWGAVCWLLASGRMSVAAAGTAVIALRGISTAIGGIVGAGTSMYGTGLYMDHWQQFLEYAGGHRMTHRRGTEVVHRPRRFRAEKVGFTYHGKDTPAVDGVDLDLDVGRIVAVVGENGSGKSTLANLVTGLYLPTDGRVTWDGHDTRDLAPEAAWKNICYLTQEVVRWPLVARENITHGQERADHDAALPRALAASGADEVVTSLKHGLHTMLAHEFMGGTELSGGQWQRINIARAFYRDGTLLVLDEPTSALDPRAEHRIFAGLREQARDRAILLITHRLANVAVADEIIVLDHGRVLQRGTFTELIESDGLFAELWHLQQDR